MPLYTALMLVIGTVMLWLITETDDLDFTDLMDLLSDGEWWAGAGIVFAIAVAAQAVFLIPMFGRRPPRGERSGSMLISLCIGALLAAVLVGGFFMSLLDALALAMPDRFEMDDKADMLWWLVLIVFIGSWGFWTFCLLVFVKGIWADRVLGRMVGLLLAGTALELFVVLPIYIMVRRKTDCYCATGSFFGLCAGAASALWLAGPGIFVALLSSRHRAWRRDYCGQCGYARGPSPGPACPECGFDWNPKR